MKKINRLTKNQDFLNIIKNGKKLQNNFFSFYYIKSKNTKIGISIPKKNVKLAVDRNLLKRQISVIFDKNFNFDLNLNVVLITKKEILNLSFQEILYNLLNLFNKIK